MPIDRKAVAQALCCGPNECLAEKTGEWCDWEETNMPSTDAAIKAVLDGLMEPSDEMVVSIQYPIVEELRAQQFRCMIAAERERLFGEDGK